MFKSQRLSRARQRHQHSPETEVEERREENRAERWREEMNSMEEVRVRARVFTLDFSKTLSLYVHQKNK